MSLISDKDNGLFLPLASIKKSKLGYSKMLKSFSKKGFNSSSASKILLKKNYTTNRNFRIFQI